MVERRNRILLEMTRLMMSCNIGYFVLRIRLGNNCLLVETEVMLFVGCPEETKGGYFYSPKDQKSLLEPTRDSLRRTI